MTDFSQFSVGGEAGRAQPQVDNNLAAKIQQGANQSPAGSLAKTGLSGGAGTTVTGRAAVRPLSIDRSPRGPRRMSTKLILWVVGIGVLIAIALTVTLLLTSRKPKVDDLDFTVTAPSSVTTGDEVEVIVEYTNNSKKALSQVQVVTDFSSGFVLSETSVPGTGDKGTIFAMKDLPAGSADRIVLTGHLYGAADAAVPLKAKITFVPEGYTFSLEAQQVTPVTVKAPALTVDFDVPSNVHGGATVTYEADVANGGDKAIANVQVNFGFPDGFELKEADPRLTDSRFVLIPQLEAGQTKHIVVRGILNGDEKAQKTAKIVVGILDENKNFYQQIESNKVTLIASPTLSITQSASAEKVNAGDGITFVITVKNIGSAPLSNMVLTTKIDAPIINLSSLNISNGGIYKEADKQVLWDNTVVDGLKVLEPNKEFEVRVSLASSNPIGAFGKNFSISSKPAMKSGDLTIEGESKTVKIRTGISFTATRSAFDGGGAPVGSGPTTPQAGKTTTYRVTLKVKNLYNDLTGAKVTALIPLGASWQGHESTTQGSKPVFDSVQKTVIWDIGNLFAASGNTVGSEATATFDVSITPSSDQKGKSIPLVSSIKFFSRDDYVGEDVTAEGEALVSDGVQ